MSISTEETKRYFQETAIALRREGFRIEPSVGGRLGVWLDDHPICEVDQIGGITYRSDNSLLRNIHSACAENAGTGAAARYRSALPGQ